MTLTVRPSSPSSSSYMELLDPFNEGIEKIIQSIQTLEHSYDRLEKLYEETVTNSHDHSSLQQFRTQIHYEVYSSIRVANYINDLFKSILPTNILDYASDRNSIYYIKISKSENLRISKFQKKLDLARNKIVDLTIKSYRLRRRINKSFENMVRNRFYNITGEMPDDLTMNKILSIRRTCTAAAVVSTKTKTNLSADNQEMMLMKKVMKERHEIMMKIEKDMGDLVGILFGNYVMVQCQIRILNVDEVGGSYRDDKPNKKHLSVHRSIETLVEDEEKKALPKQFKLKIIIILITCIGLFLSFIAGWRLD